MAPIVTSIVEATSFTSFDSILGKTAYCDYGQVKGPVDTPEGMIGAALKKRVESIDPETCEADEESTFFVADLGEVYRQHMRWKKNLPRIKPFYAVKCNPDPEVIRLLAALGTGFDCASKAEIDQVLAAGVEPSRIIYAQPCKTNSYVRHAKAQGVSQMTFDNGDELHKIAKLYPAAELFLRISTDDSSSLCQLSLKFGAAMDATYGLLALAKELGLNVVGVSFHVGSGASDPLAFRKAVLDARTVFDQALKLGYDLHTLDVGGGFSSSTFEEMAATLREAVDENFPANVKIISEPGRYYVANAFTLASNVIARRTMDNDDGSKSYMLYLNDGLYGNFSSIMFDHQHPEAKLLSIAGQFLYDKAAAFQVSKDVASLASSPAPSLISGFDDSDSDTDASLRHMPVSRAVNAVEYSIWGPTCDGIDQISSSIFFDGKRAVDVGDWFYFTEMGAYTKCSATRFNGFTDSHDVIYVCSESGARALLEL